MGASLNDPTNHISAITTEPVFWRGAHWPLIGRVSPLVVSQRAFGGAPRGESRGSITKGVIWHTTNYTVRSSPSTVVMCIQKENMCNKIDVIEEQRICT